MNESAIQRFATTAQKTLEETDGETVTLGGTEYAAAVGSYTEREVLDEETGGYVKIHGRPCRVRKELLATAPELGALATLGDGSVLRVRAVHYDASDTAWSLFLIEKTEAR